MNKLIKVILVVSIFLISGISTTNAKIDESNNIPTDEKFAEEIYNSEDYCWLGNWTIIWDKPSAETNWRFRPWAEYDIDDPIICHFPELNGKVQLKFKINCTSYKLKGTTFPRISIYHNGIFDMAGMPIYVDELFGMGWIWDVPIHPGKKMVKTIVVENLIETNGQTTQLKLKCTSYGFPFGCLSPVGREYFNLTIIPDAVIV